MELLGDGARPVAFYGFNGEDGAAEAVSPVTDWIRYQALIGRICHSPAPDDGHREAAGTLRSRLDAEPHVRVPGRTQRKVRRRFPAATSW